MSPCGPCPSLNMLPISFIPSIEQRPYKMCWSSLTCLTYFQNVWVPCNFAEDSYFVITFFRVCYHGAQGKFDDFILFIYFYEEC